MCCLLLPWLTASALDAGSARFRRLDSRAGLSQDSIQAMVEDEQGWIWLGTQDGLNRFDGYDVRVFRADPKRPGSLGSNWISALLRDQRGRLWVGSSNGLYRYRRRSDDFQRVALHSEQGDSRSREFVHDLHLDARGRLWIGSDAGLSLYPTTPSTAGSAPPGPSATTWPLRDAGDRSALVVRAIASDASGQLWLGTPQGLLRFDPATHEVTPAESVPELGASPINDLLFDDTGDLWIASDQAGLIRYRPRTGARWTLDTDSTPAIGHNRCLVLQQTDDGAIWLGSEAGAYRISASEPAAMRVQPFPHRPHDPYSVGQGRVPSFLQGRDGSFWIGTWEGGAARLHPQFSRFLSFSNETAATASMLDPRVQALAAEGDDLWLGSSRGAYRFDTRNYQLHRIDGLQQSLIFALALSPETLWAGTGEGLLCLDRRQGIVSRIEHIPELVGARVRRLLIDQSRLWLFAELHGLYVLRLPDLNVEAVHQFAGNVLNIAALDADTMAVSSADGLHLLSRDGRERRFSYPANHPELANGLAAMPSSSYLAADGRRWLGLYGAGLFELLPGSAAAAAPLRLRDATASRGLANAGVNSLLGDARGRIWMATDRGISVFDPATSELRNFDASDGTLDRGYYFSAAARLASGRLAFGSKNGFTLFDPATPDRTAPPPPPVLTALEHAGRSVAPVSQQPDSPLPRPLHLLDRVQLPPGWGRSIAIHFASADFLTANRLRYRYQLEGFDERWNEVPADRRIASYTNLAPGGYQLRVVAVAPDGSSSSETRLSIEIAPYWWQTWLARLAALALLLLAASSAYRWRVRQLQRRSEWLEVQVSQRTQDLQVAKQRAESALGQLQSAQQELVRAEKLSALGQLVAGVAHEVNTPLGVALTASSHVESAVTRLERQLSGGRLARSELQRFVDEAREGSQMIQRNLERAADLVRNFKQVSVDRSSDGRRSFNLLNVLQELTQSLKLLWKPRPIELRVQCPADIEMDSFPGALGQVLTNLAQNAVLHAFADDGGGEMRISVRLLDEQRIELVFSDDGKGIPAADLHRVFEPFYTTRRHLGGTGLGLSIVHNLVTAKLGGSIEASSEPGHGTRFLLTLPLRA